MWLVNSALSLQCINMTIYLRGASDHVLDEVPVSRGINDGHVVLCGLKLPQSNVNGDTTLTLCLQFVQHPGVLEGALAHLLWSRQHNQSRKYNGRKAMNQP